jgi:radical SAM superfamily enzyme YgiQ (UPF0313 family)
MSGTQWWPIQLGYLGAFLESKGYTVKLLDAQSYDMNDYNAGTIVSRFNPGWIVVYAGNESFQCDLAYAKFLNKNVCPTKLAGPFYALHALDVSIPGIRGELEKGVLAWIEGKANADNIITGHPLTSDELNDIPFVSDFFSLQLDPKYYRTPSEPWPFVDIMTGRGCEWGNCTFCLWPKVYKKGYAVRSIANVIEEVAKIEESKKFKSIMIQDDTFTEERAMKFSDLKIGCDLRIPWSCYTRANLNVNTMRLMKAAGCLNLHVGYESGNESTLRKICKGIAKDRMEAFTRHAKAVGLRIHGDFLIGIDETEDDIIRTVEWACKLSPDTAQFQVYIPYDGTETAIPKERLMQMAKIAYRKFYSRPEAWPAVARQILKPEVLKASIKTVLGVR